MWHTDQIFNPKPAKATILYAKETPNAGGDTLFANMYLAYETLSEPMKALLTGVKTWNVGDRKKLMQGEKTGITRDAPYTGNEKMAAKVRDPGDDLQTEAAHPSRAHPPRDRPQGALHQQSHANTPRLQGRRSAADHRFFADTCGRTRVYVSLSLGGRVARYLGQPLHPASRAQRLPRQASTHASDYDRG